MAEPEDNKLLDNADWENLLLQLELDLRSQFFFIAYLQSVRSSICPRLGGELAKIPTIIDILKTCEKNDEYKKPLNIPAQFTVDAYHYVLEDLTRLKLTKKKRVRYDYLKDEMFRSTHELPPTVTFEDQLENLGGYEIYSILVGEQSIRATWHGQLRLRPDAVEQSLDILMFRYRPNPPYCLYKVQKHKCQKVSDFLLHDIPKYEASRLLRISIPIDHIGGIHLLPAPGGYTNRDFKVGSTVLESPAVLGIDIMHPVNFYTRRVNCTHYELNEWKEREDFTKNKLGSTYTRYLLCGPLGNLFKTVGTLVRFRPFLRHKLLKGIPDITTVSVQQFGPTHNPPHEHTSADDSNGDDETIPQEVLDVLIKNDILDPNHTQKDYPLDGYDLCFQDFLVRIKDPAVVDQSLKADLIELDPPCKVKEYMMDHRGLTGSHFSFCKGKIVGDDVYHCKKCKICAGLDHWHSHSHKKNSEPPCEPDNSKFLYPIPLSGKLHASHSDRQRESRSFDLVSGTKRGPNLNESGNASGVDDLDEPAWPNPKEIPDAVDSDWKVLTNFQSNTKLPKRQKMRKTN
eukprot:Phypoly_transcript_05722.p1 GENE.Phypoly_transcript_05722~~Phypoly_transcript_05722.p1  ORF type:complete len:570 (+),score=36.16 Phypoly_transcript_05722:85-1794(+)